MKITRAKHEKLVQNRISYEILIIDIVLKCLKKKCDDINNYIKSTKKNYSNLSHKFSI